MCVALPDQVEATKHFDELLPWFGRSHEAAPSNQPMLQDANIARQQRPLLPGGNSDEFVVRVVVPVFGIESREPQPVWVRQGDCFRRIGVALLSVAPGRSTGNRA